LLIENDVPVDGLIFVQLGHHCLDEIREKEILYFKILLEIGFEIFREGHVQN